MDFWGCFFRKNRKITNIKYNLRYYRVGKNIIFVIILHMALLKIEKRA